MAEADPATPPIAAETAPAEDAPPRPRRRWLRLAVMLLVPVATVAGATAYWLSLEGKVSTDNAYVQQDKIAVSAEVGGRIVAVGAKEGDSVAAGQLLFRIDQEPFRLQVAQADAAIAGAQADVIAMSNDAALSGATISAAREDIAFAQATLDRQKALWDRGFTTRADYEAAQHAVQQGREALRQAEASQREAAARLARGPAVPGENPRVAAAQAQRAAAELSLRRTEVRAPAAGRIAQADRLQVGQHIVAGLPVLTVVAVRDSTIEANFKETDLAEMAVGQRAEVRFDAYPGVRLKGRVASIGAGTGSEFSVLPAQNATGNWVKVTQRVPVKIALDEPSPRPLIAGISAHVTVFTRERGD